MIFSKIIELLEDFLPHVTFTGGAAVSLYCAYEQFSFQRKTNDIDITANLDLKTKGDLESHLSSLPNFQIDPANRLSTVSHYKIDNFKIDILPDNITFLPSQEIEIADKKINIAKPSNIAAVKLSRFVSSFMDESDEIRSHDILDTSILNHLALKDPASYDSFVKEVCLLFATQISAYDITYEEGVETLNNFSKNISKLKDLMPTDDPESPLFEFRGQAIDNTVNAFLKFCEAISTELASKDVYSEISKIISDKYKSVHSKQMDLCKFTEENFFQDADAAKDFAKRTFSHPHIGKYSDQMSY